MLFLSYWRRKEGIKRWQWFVRCSSYLRELAWVASIRFTYIPSYLYAVCVIAIISITYMHYLSWKCILVWGFIDQDSRFEDVWKCYRCQSFWYGNLSWLVSCCLVGMCFGSSWSIIYACMAINNIISFHLIWCLLWRHPFAWYAHCVSSNTANAANAMECTKF